MLPNKMSQLYWDALLEVSVQSTHDDSIYTGLFFNDQRRTLVTDSPLHKHPYRFSPTVTKFNANMISINFNFVDLEQLTVSNQATVRIRVKEPSMFVT